MEILSMVIFLKADNWVLQLNWKQYLLVSFSGEAIHWSDLLKPWVLSSQRHYRVHYPLTLSPSLHTLGYQAPCAFSPVTSMAVKWFYHTTSPIDIIALIAHSQITSNTEGVHNMFYISLLPTLYILGPFECDKNIFENLFWTQSDQFHFLTIALLFLCWLLSHSQVSTHWWSLILSGRKSDTRWSLLNGERFHWNHHQRQLFLFTAGCQFLDQDISIGKLKPTQRRWLV